MTRRSSWLTSSIAIIIVIQYSSRLTRSAGKGDKPYLSLVAVPSREPRNDSALIHSTSSISELSSSYKKPWWLVCVASSRWSRGACPRPPNSPTSAHYHLPLRGRNSSSIPKSIDAGIGPHLRREGNHRTAAQRTENPTSISTFSSLLFFSSTHRSASTVYETPPHNNK